MEQSSLERTVHRIPALRSNVAGNKTRLHGRQRVAAYCRVSSEKDEQLNSFDVQVNYYTEKISGNPVWKMAGIYADEGITGTSMKHREDFKRMLRACREGRIDIILCKHIDTY